MAEPSHGLFYARFVKPLETQHQGEFVAVNVDERVLLDKNDLTVVDQALKQFGPGTFVLLRAGSKGVGKWRREDQQECRMQNAECRIEKCGILHSAFFRKEEL